MLIKVTWSLSLESIVLVYREYFIGLKIWFKCRMVQREKVV